MQQATSNYRDRDYWIVQNAQYAEPSFRLMKLARLVGDAAKGRECDLLDVGCGPGALRPLLPPNLHYHGMDIAIQQPAPFFREVDFASNPIAYDHKTFDFIVAMGVLEYMGEREKQKFEEIRDILKPGGKFIMSYINFGHYRRAVWPNYNNIKPIAAMAESLKQVFRLERVFPASHHWRQKQPGKNSLQSLQMHVNFNIPVFSPMLAVEYFFVCSHKK